MGLTVLVVVMWVVGWQQGVVLRGKRGGVSARFRESAGLTDGFRLCLGSTCIDVNIGLNS